MPVPSAGTAATAPVYRPVATLLQRDHMYTKRIQRLVAPSRSRRDSGERCVSERGVGRHDVEGPSRLVHEKDDNTGRRPSRARHRSNSTSGCRGSKQAHVVALRLWAGARSGGASTTFARTRGAAWGADIAQHQAAARGAVLILARAGGKRRMQRQSTLRAGCRRSGGGTVSRGDDDMEVNIRAPSRVWALQKQHDRVDASGSVSRRSRGGWTDNPAKLMHVDNARGDKDKLRETGRGGDPKETRKDGPERSWSEAKLVVASSSGREQESQKCHAYYESKPTAYIKCWVEYGSKECGISY
ncbi:hypothetical protein B0H11DRAFT_2385652 [Mycena galericulata]|nr:hypothetical protein B0H11DRAFT_2385652 [Mycena galericulata]